MKVVVAALLICIASACSRSPSSSTTSSTTASPSPSASSAASGCGDCPGKAEVTSGEITMHGHGRGPGMAADRGGGGLTAMCQVGAGSLPPDARAAVIRALADERRAEALYVALDAKVGSAPSPFPHVLGAERHHTAELERLLTAHGESVPTVDVPAPVALQGGAKEACALGAQSERANIALYDELLAEPLPADVRCVFEHLRSASAERHLPAFERCAG